MRKFQRIAGYAFALSMLMVAPGSGRAGSLLTDYNAVVFGNLTANTGDTVGRLLVAGNATIGDAVNGGSYSVGLTQPGGGAQLPQNDPSRDDLIVGGNLTSYIKYNGFVVNSNVVHGGTLTAASPIGHTTPGAANLQISPITIDVSTGNVDRLGNGISLNSLKGQYDALANSIAGLAANGSTTVSFSSVTLNNGSGNLQVFDLNGGDFTSKSDLYIDAPSGATVVVNISGASIDKMYGAIHLSGGIDQTHILFNFTDATSLKLTGFAMTGSVLAMDALNSTFSGGSINGIGVFGGNVTSTQNGFEFHNFPFAGTIQTIPEPTSLSLIALAGIGYIARFLKRHRIGLTRV